MLRGIINEKYFLVGGVKADFASLEESFGHNERGLTAEPQPTLRFRRGS